jgi:hypothetical protein
MIKIGWGSRIAILYGGFVLLIGIMVTMCINQHIDLVSEDYYEKELRFQDKINEMDNANELNENITHSFSGNELKLQFPLSFKHISGTVFFFRPSDAAKDLNCALSPGANNVQSVDLNKLSKGMYKMQISWTSDSTNYFSEETIVVP